MIGRSARGDVTMKTVEIEPTFESWQAAARALLRDGVPPADVRWREAPSGEQPLLPSEAAVVRRRESAAAVPGPGASGRRRVRSRPLADPLTTRSGGSVPRGPRAVEATCTIRCPPPPRAPDAGSPSRRATRAAVVRARGRRPRRAHKRAAARAARAATSTVTRPETVFGRGPADARRIVFVVASSRAIRKISQGAPFVGPAGERIRPGAGRGGSSSARRYYVTNAVKHFKFEQRGKRRIHQHAAGARAQRVSSVARSRADADQAGHPGLPGRHRCARSSAISSGSREDRGRFARRRAGHRRRSRPTALEPSSAGDRSAAGRALRDADRRSPARRSELNHREVARRVAAR